MALNLELLTDQTRGWSELEKYILNDSFEVDKIREAFDYAKKAHMGQKRLSGEDYINHALWVTKVVAQLSIGQEAVITALLHDTVDDNKVKIDDIAREFGDEVALLVGGLTEVRDKTKTIVVHETNIEVFRKFLFSSVDDVRVLIIRLVNELHNGMTIEYLDKGQQIKFANKIFGIYSPIAEYVGLHYFKRLLDDIAFKIIYPQEAENLISDFKKSSKDEIKALVEVKETIYNILEINKINNILVEGRIKSLYSTFSKIKNKGYERVKDRVGIRILTESIEDCYTILGLLHAKYKYLPDEFDDYISNPKPNGYRSIQTTLSWKDKLTVEVQIRTKEMHEFNEFGPASHIAYKANEMKSGGSGYAWVKELVNWQKNEKEVKNYRIDVLNKFIYVFTPKGDTIQIPKGSCALDFAYRIHSDIGNHCYGVKINQKMAKISDELNNGDLVEILTSKTVFPNKNWLEIARTPMARERIRKELSNKNYGL
jgi:GTP pyrophosphokinase